MSEFVVLNGRKMPASEAVLPVTNRAFRYGDSLFESLRMLEGSMPFWSGHLKRLTIGAQRLGFLCDPEQLRHELWRGVQLLTEMRGNYRVRLQVWREGEGLYRPLRNDVGYLVEAVPLPSGRYELAEPVTVKTNHSHFPLMGTLYGLKTGSALPYVATAVHAQYDDFDDWVLYNPDGSVAEAMRGNLFLVFGQERLLAPPPDLSGIMGIMCDVVTQLAPQMGLEVHNKEPLHLESSLPFASAAFITNSVSGLIPVSKMGRKTFQNFDISARITEVLNELVDAKRAEIGFA